MKEDPLLHKTFLFGISSAKKRLCLFTESIVPSCPIQGKSSEEQRGGG